MDRIERIAGLDPADVRVIDRSAAAASEDKTVHYRSKMIAASIWTNRAKDSVSRTEKNHAEASEANLSTAGEIGRCVGQARQHYESAKATSQNPGDVDVILRGVTSSTLRVFVWHMYASALLDYGYILTMEQKCTDLFEHGQRQMHGGDIFDHPLIDDMLVHLNKIHVAARDASMLVNKLNDIASTNGEWADVPVNYRLDTAGRIVPEVMALRQIIVLEEELVGEAERAIEKFTEAVSEANVRMEDSDDDLVSINDMIDEVEDALERLKYLSKKAQDQHKAGETYAFEAGEAQDLETALIKRAEAVAAADAIHDLAQDAQHTVENLS